MLKNTYHKTLILYTIGGSIGLLGIYLFDKHLKIKNKAVKNVKKEWEKWGEQTYNINSNIIKQGHKEYEKEFSDVVNKYWREGVGLNYHGTDRDVAWSAALISYIFKISGAKNKFLYSPSHSTYIRDSISNRKNNDFKKPFVGFKVTEYAPQVGDLVCYSRETNPNLYDVTTPYKSHCDIVIKKGKNYIEVIGGNVGQGLSKKILKTDTKGFLVDKNHNWFAVLKTNI